MHGAQPGFAGSGLLNGQPGITGARPLKVGRFQQGIDARRRDAVPCDHWYWLTPPLTGATPLRDMRKREPIDCLDNAAGSAAPTDLEQLYRDRAPLLRRRLRGHVRSNEEASDLVHDAFARLLGAPSLEVLRDPGAFLNRIVRNLLVDRSRRLSHRATHVPIDDAVEIPVPPDQGEAIEVEQMRQRYRELVDQLPPRTREVFLLHRIEGFSYREIAARLDIGVRTVEWHIAQAIVRISRGLDGE